MCGQRLYERVREVIQQLADRRILGPLSLSQGLSFASEIGDDVNYLGTVCLERAARSSKCKPHRTKKA